MKKEKENKYKGLKFKMMRQKNTKNNKQKSLIIKKNK